MLDEAAPTLGSNNPKDESGRTSEAFPALRGFTRVDNATGLPIAEMSPTSRIKAKVNTAEIKPSAALQKFLSLGASASVPVFASSSMQSAKPPTITGFSRPPLPPKDNGSSSAPAEVHVLILLLAFFTFFIQTPVLSKNDFPVSLRPVAIEPQSLTAVENSAAEEQEEIQEFY